jgi:hypothetical protein
MHRRWALLPLLLVLAAPARAADSTLPVTLTRFAGLPADSTDRKEFMEAFRATMEADLPCESRQGDAWSSSGPRRNPFRVVDVAPPDEAWTLDLSIRIPPTVRIVRAKPKNSKLTPRPRMSDVRTSRGLIIVASVVSPSAAMQGAPSAPPLRFAVYFANSRRILMPSSQVPSGGYEYSWTDAGSVVARAALEVLHRANGGLSENERADLEPATRMEEPL